MSAGDLQSFIDVNCGQVTGNLPPPASTATLLRSNSIGKRPALERGADPAIVKALANNDILAMASNHNFVAQWINTNVAPTIQPTTSCSLPSETSNEVANDATEFFLSFGSLHSRLAELTRLTIQSFL